MPEHVHVLALQSLPLHCSPTATPHQIHQISSVWKNFPIIKPLLSTACLHVVMPDIREEVPQQAQHNRSVGIQQML